MVKCPNCNSENFFYDYMYDREDEGNTMFEKWDVECEDCGYKFQVRASYILANEEVID